MKTWNLEDVLSPVLTSREYDKYVGIVRNITYLSNWLARQPSVEEVCKALKAELTGQRRDFIIHKLLGRLHNLYNQNIHNQVADWMGRN